MRGNPTMAKGFSLIDSRIILSMSLSSFTASRVHTPPNLANTEAASSRSASTYPSSGSELNKSRITFWTVKLVECSEMSLTKSSRCATRFGSSWPGWPFAAAE